MSDVALSQVLAGQYRKWDRLLEAADNRCGPIDGPKTQTRFCDAMECHIEVKERGLFPVLEGRMAPAAAWL